MPKRITLPLLSEHDDDWLRIMAWLNNTSKSTQAANSVSAHVRQQKAEMQEMLNYIAQKRGITAQELMKSVLEGRADRPDELEDE